MSFSDFSAWHGRQTENLSADVCEYWFPPQHSVRGSAYSIPNPSFFPSARQNKVWRRFLFLSVIENIWRFSSSEVATADEQLARKRVVMLPYSVFLIEEQIIYFGEKM